MSEEKAKQDKSHSYIFRIKDIIHWKQQQQRKCVGIPQQPDTDSEQFKASML
jgi:hypothetical protein